jgi:outer membrane protein
MPSRVRTLALCGGLPWLFMLLPAFAQTDPCPAADARALTLRAALLRAQCLDPALAQARASLSESRAATDERRAALRPSLSAALSPSASTRHGSGSDTHTAAVGASLALNHTLADHGARAARVTQSERQSQAAQSDVASQSQDTLRDVVNLWSDAREAQAALAAAASAQTAAQASLAAAQARFSVGTATRVDVLSAQSAQAQSERDRLNAQSDLRARFGLLAQRLGWPATSEITLVGDDLQVLRGALAGSELAIDALMAELERGHPQLQAQRERVQAARAAADAARADGRSTLALTGQTGPQWNRSNAGTPSGGVDSNTHWNTEIGLTWSLPLSDGGARQARIGQALAQLERAQAQERSTLRTLADNLWQRYTAWRDAETSLRASLVAVAAAQEAEAAQRGRYGAGLGTLTDLLTAQSTLTQSQRQAITAQQQRVRAGVGLAHALGRLVPDALPNTPTP